jgi:hypothetical protein
MGAFVVVAVVILLLLSAIFAVVLVSSSNKRRAVNDCNNGSVVARVVTIRMTHDTAQLLKEQLILRNRSRERRPYVIELYENDLPAMDKRWIRISVE